MINWSTVPMTFNDAWSYLEMLGKMLTVVQQDHDRVTDIEIDSEQIHKNEEACAENAEAILALSEDLADNYYTKTECDLKYPTFDDVYTIQEALDTFATIIWANAADIRIGRLEDALNTRKGVYFFSVTDGCLVTTVGTTSTITVTKPQTDYDAIEVHLNTSLNDGTNSAYIADSFYGLAGASQTYSRVVTISGVQTYYTVTVDLTGTGDTFTVVFTGIKVSGLESAEAVVYLADTPISPTVKQQYYDKADANGDGEITAEDARMIQSFYGAILAGQQYTNDLAGWEAWLEDNGYSVVNPVYPDADRDGIVSLEDALLVMQYYTKTHLTHEFADTVENWYLFSTGQTPVNP